jgi:LacI family transcriptional regulator
MNRNCTAVFADNVSIAVGTVAAAAELLRAIPDDLSVIAMHDVPLASHVVPPLTAVKTPLSQLGARSVDVLHAILTKGDAPHLSIVRNPAPIVVQRLSTAPPPGDRRHH